MWAAADKAGDTQTKNDAHTSAKGIRAQSGYSGGSDGSQVISLSSGRSYSSVSDYSSSDDYYTTGRTSVSSAGSIDQANTNSAAWKVAESAGDKATMATLAAANALYRLEVNSSGSGTVVYDSARGSSTYTQSDGTKVTNDSTLYSTGGKVAAAVITTTDISGTATTQLINFQSDSSMTAYVQTYSGNQQLATALANAYNARTDTNAAQDLTWLTLDTNNAKSLSRSQLNEIASMQAKGEAYVAATINGWSASKQAEYESQITKVKSDFYTALKNGNQSGMDAANAEGERLRGNNNYTGSNNLALGGHYASTEDASVYHSSR